MFAHLYILTVFLWPCLRTYVGGGKGDKEREKDGGRERRGARDGERERSNFLFLEGHQLYWIRLNLITSFSFSYPLKTISSNAALFMDKAPAMNLRGT